MITFLLLPLFVLTSPVVGQEGSLELVPDYEIRIDGTSNVRDWDAYVTAVDHTFILDGFTGNPEDLTPEQFQALRLEMPVEDIDSGNRRMTRNIHGYLEEDDHPVVIFEMTQVHGVQSSSPGMLIDLEGIVTAAGEEHPVRMEVSAIQNDDGSVTFSGTQELAMTDFGIDPPTVMLGAISAADELTITYELTFTR